VLALSRRTLRSRDRASRGQDGATELVHAWTIRMTSASTADQKSLRRERRACSTPLAYAEIGITTNFSFLRGGSHPQDYVHQASLLQLPVIGIADRNTLAGVVRAYNELE